MPRGRLIFPFAVELAQLDTVATAADPDGAGPLTEGYDFILREPRIVPPASGSGRGTVNRVETMVTLQAQIEPAQFEQLEMMASGRNASSRMALVFHYQDLENAGVIDTSTGRPLIKAPGDRLHAIRNVRSGALIEMIPNPPGLFAVEVQSRGFGLGPDRNLLLVTFEEREQSARG